MFKKSVAGYAITLSLLLPVLAGAVSSPEAGKVCFIRYSPKQWDKAWDARAEFLIDGVQKLPLVGAHPRILVEGLDVQKKHTLELIADGKVSESWSFRFKSKTHMVNFWRSAGYWHLEQNTTGACTVPEPKKSND